MSNIRSERRRIKELKVLELNDKGFPSRQIAKLAHVSLREVTKYIRRISNKTKSASTISVMDEVILEYRVNNLLHNVRDLKMQKENLTNELRDLRAEIHYSVHLAPNWIKTIPWRFYVKGVKEGQ